MIKNKKGIGIVLIALLIIFCIVILIITGFVSKVISIPVKTVTNQVDSAIDIVDKTYNADNAIYNYEWFKTQYEKIQANRNQIQITNDSINEFKQTYGSPSSWDYETKQEYNRLNTIKMGLQNQEENLVAEYNARSKMANREIFKDKLPLYVDRILW